MNGTQIEKKDGKLVMRADAAGQAAQRLDAIKPDDLRGGTRGLSVADLRAIVADLLDALKGTGHV